MPPMRVRSARFYHWSIAKASSERAPLWLALLFSLEIILFIPLDAVLVFFCLQRRDLIALYILIATISSVLSGLVGYFLGHFLWDLVEKFVIPHFISASSFAHLAHQLDKYEHWAVVFGTLVPFPLKALSLAAGVFQLGAASFAIYMALARVVRFGLIGSAMFFWGEKVKSFIDRHFGKLFMLIGAKIAMITLGVWVFSK
jgi:membrane protein YqaA with SNARE-associated domain